MSGPETPLSTLIKNSDHHGILRHIRAHKLPNSSALVVSHGEHLLKSKSWHSSLTEIERLASLEQIFVAALEEQNSELSKKALNEIHKEVVVTASKDINGISVRYRKLLALSLESDEDYDRATEIYSNFLAENPSNSFAQKRKYCILKSQGKSKDARAALNTYLEDNGQDVGAWVEMANNCMEIGDFKGASYCYEEVVLTSPMDAKVHCILGELYSTMGGKENLKLARKHLAMSLELEPNNLRAVFALVCAAETYLQLVDENEATNSINKKKKSDFDEDDVEMAKDLYEYGVGKLSKIYKGTFMSSLLDLILAKED